MATVIFCSSGSASLVQEDNTDLLLEFNAAAPSTRHVLKASGGYTELYKNSTSVPILLSWILITLTSIYLSDCCWCSVRTYVRVRVYVLLCDLTRLDRAFGRCNAMSYLHELYLCSEEGFGSDPKSVLILHASSNLRMYTREQIALPPDLLT